MDPRDLSNPDARNGRPYLLCANDVASDAGVDPGNGLTAEEARVRLERHGPNILKETEARSVLSLLLAQLRNPLLVILMIGAAISGWSGHWIDAAAILAIVLINAAISFWQEWNAAKTMAALTEMAAPRATVRRDGAWQDVAAADLVPGDVLRLQRGDIVGADIRLLEAAQLQIDEAALTGESEPVDKHTGPLAPGPDGDVPPGDRLNMAYSSTQVGKSAGVGIVTATGMHTEVGRIAGLMAAAEEPKTPLQVRIDALARVLMGAALVVVALVVGIGLTKGMNAAEILNTAISLSVSTIPEGLPTIVTIVLALGSQSMARQNALVRKLASVETLGTTSVICSDKTGTLTSNKMQVMRVWAGGASYEVTGNGCDPTGAFLDADGAPVDAIQHGALKALLALSAWCNEAELATEDGAPAVRGNPTEGALLVAAAKAGITRAALSDRHGLETLQAFPFDSTRKMMSLLSDVPGIGRVLVAKGAPDVILARATHVEMDGAPVPLDDAIRAEVEGVIAAFGADALRTLAVAYRRVPEGELGGSPADYERDVVIVGIHGIMDPPRDEVAAAVAEARSASVRTVMITGDHAATAEAIAGRIGIRTSAEQTVHTGADVEAMSDDALIAAVEHAAVFARVTPEHKLRIVRALQARGEVVAMTGDGVNDAPALRSGRSRPNPTS